MNGGDPGLQPERTTLAWQRTSLAAAVAAVLLLRSGIARTASLQIAAGVCLAIALVLAGIASRIPAPTGSSRWLLLCTTAAAVFGGLLTTVDILLRFE